MPFCCCKDHQKAALEEAMTNADKMVSHNMDAFSLDIAAAIKERVQNKETATIPEPLLGAHPHLAMEGKDEAGRSLSASIQLQCLNGGKENATTCSGKGHSVIGKGQDEQGEFEIIEGKWSPAGYCYWVEKRIRNGKEEMAFVMLYLAETSEATVTMWDKKGNINRSRRNMKLFAEKQVSRDLLCPSVRTVVSMKNN